jgi:phosphonate transport system substrate-binding protein
MFSHRYTGLFAIIVLFIVTACSPAAQPTATAAPTPSPTSAAQAAARPLILADISDDPASTIEDFQPLADYLAERLKDHGISEGQVVAAADLEQMTDMMKSGEVDLYFDSVYPVMIISDAADAKPILRRWKEGVEEYHSVIFARKDSGLKTLDDLKGHVIGLEDNYSTSAFMLPLAYLAEAGLNATEKTDTDATVSDDEVGYVFSGDDENTIQWILSEKVVAGAVNSGAYAEIPEAARADLVILKETETLPRHVALVRGDMDADLQAALTEILLGMDEDEDGKAVLAAFEETVKFDEFPGDVDDTLARMRELFALVQGEAD